MRKALFLKPAKGLIVRDPETGSALSADGEHKPDTAYWRRRLRDQDVVIATSRKKKSDDKANGGTLE